MNFFVAPSGTSNNSSKPPEDYKMTMRVHVYHEEKSGSYRVFFFYDKQRCLGSFGTKEQADTALNMLHTRLAEKNMAKDKEAVDALVAHIRSTVRGPSDGSRRKSNKYTGVDSRQAVLTKIQPSITKVTPSKPKPKAKPKARWGKVEECRMLLSALDNPSHVLERGFPYLEGMQDNEALTHWNKFLENKSHSTSYNVSSLTDRSFLQTCMVLAYEEYRYNETQEYEKTHATSTKKTKERLEDLNNVRNSVTTEALAVLKGNVLLSSGWRILPLNLVSKQGVMTNPFQSSLYHKPSPRASKVLSDEELIKSSKSLMDAWGAYIQQLRSGIEYFIPQQQQQVTQEQAVVEVQEDNYGEAAYTAPVKKIGRKGKKTKGEPGVIPKHVQNMMTARARFVSEGDPRPSMQCSWCGPKHWSRKIQKQQASKASGCDASSTGSTSTPAHVICKACQLLYRDGWRMDDTTNSNTFLSSTVNNRRWADYVFRNKNKGVSLRSVKTFLLQTSPFIADICVNNPERLEDMEETMVISKAKKERGGYAYSGDSMYATSSSGRGRKRRKSVRDDDSYDDEHSVESISSCVSSSYITSDDENQTSSSALDDTTMIPAILSTIPSNNDPTTITTSQNKLKLPTIDDLLNEEHGLSGILKSDEYGILNVHFGNDAEIICQVLSPLANGKLPSIAYKETPLLRSKEELDYLHPQGGPPPSRFMGVTRIFEKTQSSDSMRPNGKFGVEIPLLFYKGRKIILRDFDREDVAGILFVFLYRLLFGSDALKEMSCSANGKGVREDIILDTLSAFGASANDKDDMVVDGGEGTLDVQAPTAVQ